MSDRYAVLHFPGDVTELGRPVTVTPTDGSPSYVVPLLCGSDVFGQPYEVLDVEYTPATDCPACDGRSFVELVVVLDGELEDFVTKPCPRCAGGRGWSTVHLEPAMPSTVRGHRAVREQRADEFLAARPARLAFARLFTAPVDQLATAFATGRAVRRPA